MKNRWILGLMLFLGSGTMYSQVTLEDVLSKVRTMSPEFGNKATVTEQMQLTHETIAARRLPGISITGQATYQSEVTSVPIDIPGMDIPTVPLSQYKIQGELRQSVYDGGITAVLQRATKNAGALEDANLEIQLEQLRSQAIHLFFSVLETQSGLNILVNKREQIDARRELLQARVDNGVVLESELHALDAARLEVEEQFAALNTQKLTLIQTLALLTGDGEWNSATVFVMPREPEFRQDVSTDLPRYIALQHQKDGLQLALDQKKAASRPNIQAFGQLGVGRPGLNFLDDALSEYYLLGLRAQWNLDRIYTRKKDEEITRLNEQKLNAARKAFDRHLNMQLTAYRNDVARYDQSISLHEDLVALRTEITRVARAQLENGAVTSAQYIEALNDENSAREQLARARTRKIMTQYMLQHVAGNYIKS